jgi:hypothetical protein
MYGYEPDPYRYRNPYGGFEPLSPDPAERHLLLTSTRRTLCRARARALEAQRSTAE